MSVKNEGTPQAKLSSAAPAVLQVQQVSKEYRLYSSARQRLRSLLTGQRLHQSHWALRGVDFALHRGECLGVIGDNGAGKSTLLKLVAGALQPSQGSVRCEGRITAILELGAGFHPEFTGRENLYFGGSLIGISHEQMRALEPEICAFAELGEALDRPVKTYSSGMTVRLAFALVTAVQPDVLIIDEALAVGDQNFQKKCTDRILQFRRNGCTILFCSHSPYHVRHLCDRAMWMVKGQVHALGPTEEVLAAYEAAVKPKGDESEPGKPSYGLDPSQIKALQVNARDAAHLKSVEVEGLQAPTEEGGLKIKPEGDLTLLMRAHVPQDTVPSFGFLIEQLGGVGITSVATHVDGAQPFRGEDGSWVVRLRFADIPLRTGDYVLSAYLFDASGLMVLDDWKHFEAFRVISSQPLPGWVSLPHTWEAV